MGNDCCGKRSHYGMCSQCTKLRELTKHHILPKVNWGNPSNTPLLHLCRPCHDIIDTLALSWYEEGREYIILHTATWLKNPELYLPN